VRTCTSRLQAIHRSVELADGIILISPRMPDGAITEFARRKPWWS
jgi:hypothetical protein